MTGQLRTGVFLWHLSYIRFLRQNPNSPHILHTRTPTVLVNGVAQWNIKWKLWPHVTYHWINKASVLFRVVSQAWSRWRMVRWTWCRGHVVSWAWSKGHAVGWDRSRGHAVSLVRSRGTYGHLGLKWGLLWLWLSSSKLIFTLNPCTTRGIQRTLITVVICLPVHTLKHNIDQLCHDEYHSLLATEIWLNVCDNFKM